MNWINRRSPERAPDPTMSDINGARTRENPLVSLLRARFRFLSDAGPAWPTIDVEETEREFHVSVDIPGVKNEDVRLRVADRALIVEGERHAASLSEPGRFTQRERGYGRFVRRLPLPSGANTASVYAQLERGTLRVTVGKSSTTPDDIREIEIV